MKLKNVRVTLASINRVASKKACEVVEVKTNYKRLDGGTFSREPESYSIVCAGNRYDTFAVKVSPATASKVTKVADALANEQDVEIEFQNLKLSLYAMLNNGVLYSGVSGRADDISVVNVLDDDFSIASTTEIEDDMEILV